MVVHGWACPNEWANTIPMLLQYQAPQLVEDVKDKVVWIDLEGKEVCPTASVVWNSIRSRGDVVD